MKPLHAVLVAGTQSGCGKTSVALGLMAALSRRGLTVQGFKTGPDFIDPGLHRLATGRASHNLDSWMLPPAYLSELFHRACQDAAIAVVEGAMGLFDGRAKDGAGSSAEVARLLGLPVLLVVDAKAMGQSLAAVVHGFASFDARLTFVGVLANQVGSARHGQILEQAMAAVPGAPLLGLLPRRAHLGLPSRHLGLVIAEDLTDAAPRLAALADWLEETGAVDAVLERLPALPRLPVPPPAAASRGPVSIGMAQDAAFSFAYADNLRLLEAAGARLVPFSPCTAPHLPPGIQGLYLPGGYPELHAQALAANAGLRAEIHALCAAGWPVWAECGGMLYLLEELVDQDGRAFPMVGFLRGRGVLEGRRQALGYREVQLAATCPLGPAGATLRGHEFHYSRRQGADPAAQPLFAAADGDLGLLKGRCAASYVHLHLGSNPAVAAHFVAACQATPPWTGAHEALAGCRQMRPTPLA